MRPFPRESPTRVVDVENQPMFQYVRVNLQITKMARIVGRTDAQTARKVIRTVRTPRQSRQYERGKRHSSMSVTQALSIAFNGVTLVPTRPPKRTLPSEKLLPHGCKTRSFRAADALSR